MKVRIYRFNMIEVLLAIVVVTLAITGVFALFPVGLNASKAATADNSISDIAEYVIAHVRADIQTKMVDNKDAKGFDNSKIGTVFSTASADTGEYDGSDESSNVIVDKGNGIYLIRQLSGPENARFEDFTAYAKVFVDEANPVTNDKFLQYDKNGKFEPAQAQFKLERFFVPVVLELSYPATVPYAEREKRYFRFEIYNHQFDPNAAAAEVQGS